jgi:isochorismate synthase EntC
MLCCVLSAEVQKSVLKQSSVQHLYGRLAGVLRRGVGDAAVLEALHPTPAVCGRPRESAMRWVLPAVCVCVCVWGGGG